MSGVLNPRLHAAMRRRFPRVKVAHGGTPMRGYYRADPERGGQKLVIVEWGESYLADCPFCGDDRGRLSVSHRYGDLDAVTGRRQTELWRCYNEECQHRYAFRAELERRLVLDALGDVAPPAVRVPAVEVVRPGELPAAELPGQTLLLTDLPPDHPANAYLGGRGFDPGELAREWGVGFCVYAPPRVRGAESMNRIVVPVRRDGLLVGWQARYPADVDFKALGLPKYLTYFPSGQVLYAADAAAAAPGPVVFVEGVTDVWRYGPGAVCRFGKKLTAAQLELALRLTRGRPVVVVPDANDPQAAGAALRDLTHLARAGYRGHAAVCPLPPGTDPARHPRPLLRDYVAAALRHAVAVG